MSRRYEGYALIRIPDGGRWLAGDVLVCPGYTDPTPDICKKALKTYEKIIDKGAGQVQGHTTGYWALRKITEPEMNEFGEVCP